MLSKLFCMDGESMTSLKESVVSYNSTQEPTTHGISIQEARSCNTAN